ncbi:unnamed protein product [Mytilus coruscus]|uniref:Peptidase aspartic putative domain-containing protein n=1 Tax=Mytilus coruscus TaxID=42192 RepID=A0A6J8BGU6_MYTCO|nr:unnamed protein product [Mytilus coruscus]
MSVVIQEGIVEAAEVEARILEEQDQKLPMALEDKHDKVSKYVETLPSYSVNQGTNGVGFSDNQPYISVTAPFAPQYKNHPPVSSEILSTMKPISATMSSQPLSATVSSQPIYTTVSSQPSHFQSNVANYQQPQPMSFLLPNNPYINVITSSCTKRSSNPVLTRKVEVSAQSDTRIHDNNNRCPIKAGHSLSECRGFQKRPFQDRQRFRREKKICFRCCQSNDHISRNCNVNVKYSICGSNRHVSSMHIDCSPTTEKISTPKTDEDKVGEFSTETISAACTRLCGKMRVGRLCGKTSIRVYAIIDNQSNRSLATPDLFDRLGLHGSQKQFVLSSCSGNSTMVGRYASGIRICSIDGQSTFEMPDVIECDSIPSNLPEIPTPDVANAHPYLRGRDLPEVHHVLEQILGGKGEPFAQKLPLGWVVIGEVCLGKVHAPSVINDRKTRVLNDGRHTTFPLCDLNIKVNDVEDHILFVHRQTTN